jgi:hypothetical protein
MCIVIQVKLKTALFILTLGSIVLGTYYGVYSIENNIYKTNDITRVKCELLSSVIDDRTGMWHNTWWWNYKNNTYHQTDQTEHVSITYTCCIKVSNPFRIASCIADKTSIYKIYISICWSLICIIFWGWLWCSCRKSVPST